MENAFLFSGKVFTFSMHLHEPGFFPGSGNMLDSGMGNGKHRNLNIPLRRGITDDAYAAIFRK